MRTRTRLMMLGISCWLALAGTAMAQDDDAADSQVRFQLNFMFPSKAK